MHKQIEDIKITSWLIMETKELQIELKLNTNE